MIKVSIIKIEALDIKDVYSGNGGFINRTVGKYEVDALVQIEDELFLEKVESTFIIKGSEMPDKISEIREKIKSLYKDDHNEKETK